jgi:hypothetical protein
VNGAVTVTGALTTNGAFVAGGTMKGASTIGVGGATPSTSGAGITFPAAVSASSDVNTLDDYEEGTWTPSLTQNGVAITSPTNVVGSYIKIGKLLFLSAYFYKSGGATSSSGQWRFANLPFSLDTAYSHAAPASYMNINGGPSTQVARFQANSSTTLDLYGQYASTSWTTSYIEMGFSGVFQTAS